MPSNGKHDYPRQMGKTGVAILDRAIFAPGISCFQLTSRSFDFISASSGSADSFSLSYRRFGEQFPTFRAIVEAKLICRARLDPIRSEGTLGRARKERLCSVIN